MEWEEVKTVYGTLEWCWGFDCRQIPWEARCLGNSRVRAGKPHLSNGHPGLSPQWQRLRSKNTRPYSLAEQGRSKSPTTQLLVT